MEGIATGIDVNMEKLRRKEGKKPCGQIQKTKWKYKVQEERVLR